MFLSKKFAILAHIYMSIFFQIILESLPISSSGHVKLLEIFNQKFKIFNLVALENFGLNFDILHLPMIFIILVVFFQDFKEILFKSLKFSKLFLQLLFFIFITTSIAVIFYFFINKLHLFSINLSFGFLITSIFLFSLRFIKCENTVKDIWSIKKACIVGVIQGLSLLPGISRFGSVFVTLRWLGYSAKVAFFFTFLIEFPLLCAGVLKGFYVLHINNKIENLNALNFNLLIVILSSVFISYVCLLLMKKMIEKNKLWILSFYMLIPAFISFLLGT